MVSSCCICSKEYLPSEPHRSFHRIPSKEEMRNKWIHIIGRTITYKGARVCSDHFTKNDYDKNPYAKIKRLKNTAVPSVSLQKEKKRKGKISHQGIAANLYDDSGIIFRNENNVTPCNSENHGAITGDDIDGTKESENASSELKSTEDTNEHLIVLNSGKETNGTCIDNQKKVDEYLENNINDTNREREFSSPILGNSEVRIEKILKSSKHSMVRFVKADFSSNEKWKAFLRCIAYNKRENRIMRQNNKFLRKKILIFQDLLQDLLRKV